MQKEQYITALLHLHNYFKFIKCQGKSLGIQVTTKLSITNNFFLPEVIPEMHLATRDKASIPRM